MIRPSLRLVLMLGSRRIRLYPPPSRTRTQIEQAETRTIEANTRAEQADVRTAQVQVQADWAQLQTDEANVRTDQAEARGNALRASELSYRRLFESARDGVLILEEATGRIADVNSFLIELLGFSRDEMLGKTVGELSPFKDLVANQAMLERLQKHGYVRYEDLPLETRDGRHIAVEFVSNVYQSGNQKMIQCNIRDITERKQTEEALRVSRQMLGEIINALPVRVFWKDKNLIYLGCNTAFARDAGFADPKDIIGKDDCQMVWREQAEAFRSDDREVIASGQPKLLIEEPLTTHEGKTVTLLSSKIPLRDAKGEIIGVLGTYMDISARKGMQESHDRLAMAVGQAAETIVITDTAGNIVYVNPAFEQNTGYTCAEAIGQNPRMFKSGKHDADFYRRMWDVLISGKAWHGHLVNRRKDGKLHEEEATISPLRGATGKVVNYVAVKRDVTREMELESQFRQAQKMEAIGTLAGGVAHDFNNILGVILIQADMLKGRGGLPADQVELVDDIREAVQRAIGLTRQLLLFSRKEVRQPHDMDLNQSVGGMTRMLRRILGEDIAVRLKLAAEPMLLHADPGMMDQVLLNLAVNARDAMLNGGQLIIETTGVEFDEFAATQTAQARPGSFVRLSVSDTGCGIPPENLSKLFEPFFTTKGVGKGTGLGLATIFGIARQHHGWINVYSEVGHGTTFRVYLPRLSETHDTAIINKTPTVAPTGHETILLVEDEPALRTTMKLALSGLGYRVLEASTGCKALQVWKEHHTGIHLLLTDLLMPDGMTGKALSQQLRQENPKLKAIYMSGYSAEIVGKDLSFQEGVNFLTKPFQVQQLAQTIRQCLDAR